MEPKSILFARFPYGGSDVIDVTDWMVETVVKCKLDPRVGRVGNISINDTPITMSRNHAVEMAKQGKFDFLLMIDSDMKPDAYLLSNKNRLDVDTSALPFWDSTFDFMLKHYEHGPCMVGAPYCGPPPHENVYIFRWANFQTDHPNADLRIEQYTREEAVIRSGFEEVACLPTGLVLLDMRVFDNDLVTAPYFTYEYTDKYEQKKCSTEDCVFTRDLNLANIPLFCNWDTWCGHWKRKCVGKPRPIFREQVHKKYIEAVLKNPSKYQRLLFVDGPSDEETRAIASKLVSVPGSSLCPDEHDQPIAVASSCSVTNGQIHFPSVASTSGSYAIRGDLSFNSSALTRGQHYDPGTGQGHGSSTPSQPGDRSVAPAFPGRGKPIGILDRRENQSGPHLL